MNAQHRIVLDALCAALIFASFAYFFTGDVWHEIAGTLAVVLLVAHNAVNFRRWKNPFAGTLRVREIFSFALNVALACALVSAAVGGAMLSDKIFPFVPAGEGLLAREIHTTGAAWLFLLSAFHAGFHAKFIAGTLKNFARKRNGKPHEKRCAFSGKIFGKVFRFGVPALAVAVSAHGIFAFARRDFPQKIFAESTFDAFAFDDAFPRFFADYFSVAALFFCIGFFTEKLISRRK